ncbi:very long chain fatty acid elongase 7-like [Epargyreus clarus]|uniref:very long chain fatty acid elongase 7-like n=1 Tax=Epargyreus clarus TaxID=520877 RepID=UPI003C2DE823
MAEIIRKIIRGYNILFHELPDTRTRDWFLVAKPYQGLILLGIYLMFVFKWGPRWMKNRPAFKMDTAIIIYNAIQMALCTILFVNSLRFWGWGGSFKWICEPVDSSNSPDAIVVAKLVYFYFITKVIDLIDTVFFVLRKKFNQASFLHVYHHTGMVLLTWGAITYYPGGHGTFIGVVNSFVHIIMYCYYLLSVAIPSIKNMLWAKKLVTQLQILQFFLFVVHMSTVIFIPECKYPRWTSAVFLPQNLFMLILFVDFYIKAYVRKPKNQKLKLETDRENKNCPDNNDNSSDMVIVENGLIKKENGDGRIEFLIRHRRDSGVNIDRT